jgi:argininosuccinate lyase
LADFLVQKGVPFRDAHHVVGGLVRQAEQQGVELSQLGEAELRGAHPALTGSEVAAVLDPASAVERRALLGGPARVRVLEAIEEAEQTWQVRVAQGSA